MHQDVFVLLEHVVQEVTTFITPVFVIILSKRTTNEHVADNVADQRVHVLPNVLHQCSAFAASSS